MKKVIYPLISGLYALLMGVIVLVCLFGQNLPVSLRQNYILPDALSMALGVGFYALALWFWRLFRHREAFRYVREVVTVVLAVALFALGSQYCYAMGWDVFRMDRNARFIAGGQWDMLNHGYYSTYPNNLLLTAIFSIVYKIASRLGIQEGYFLLLAIQSVIYALSGYFLWYAADMYFEHRRPYGTFVWGMYVLLIGFSPWMTVPYSDSYALFAVCVGFFLIMRMLRKGLHPLRMGAFTLVCVLGFFIKPQVAVLLIAVVLVLVCTNFKKLLSWKNLCAMILAVLLAWGCNQAALKYSRYSLNEEARFGMSHFAMMGWNPETRGTYNHDDALFSQSFETYDERSAANWKEFLNRIVKGGVKETATTALTKMRTNFSDGIFGWAVINRGGWHVNDGYNPNDTAITRALEWWYHREDNAPVAPFSHGMQCLWLGTLFMGLFAVKCHTRRGAVVRLAVIGLILFITLFEAGARYALAYVPLFLLLAAKGTMNVHDWLTKRPARAEDEERGKA